MNKQFFDKVIWSEGLLVVPQHFQQADRYQERNLDQRVRYLVPYGWGAAWIKLDNEKLTKHGIFALEAFSGVLPSGTCADMPRSDPVPAAIQVSAAAFGKDSARLDVYLAIPVEGDGDPLYAQGCAGTAQADTRYTTAWVTVADACSGGEETILVAQRNYQLIAGPLPGGFEGIKIAELLRRKDGRVALNEEYVPPALALSGAPFLAQQLLPDLAARITARIDVLLPALSERPFELQRRNGELRENLALVGSLNAALAGLNHFQHVGSVHPEVVYGELLRLAGQLAVWSPEVRIADFPAYAHDDLAGCFIALGRILVSLLRRIPAPPEERFTVIELKEAGRLGSDLFLYTDALREEWLLPGEYRLYLVVEARIAREHHGESLGDQFARNVTVAAFEKIESYIDHAFGLRLIPAPPFQGESPSQEVAYFELESSGEIWEDIKSLRTLAIFVPGAFRKRCERFKVHLVAVRSERSNGRKRGKMLDSASSAS